MDCQTNCNAMDGGSPQGHVLQAGKCRECNTDPQSLAIFQTIFVVVGTVVLCLILFLIAWTPVFGTSAEEIITKYLYAPFRMLRQFKSAKDDALDTVKRGRTLFKYFSDPKNVKLSQQYMKVRPCIIKKIVSDSKDCSSSRGSFSTKRL